LFDELDPPAAEAVDLILARAKEHGLRAGIHLMTPEWAKKRIEMGFDLVTIASDARLLAVSAKDAVEAMRK
jgi:4-hydroxy-2-oxoheptanedioate aldolase